jgi:hypothetical protein
MLLSKKLVCGVSDYSKCSRAIPLLIKNFNSAAVERRVCMMRSRIPVVIDPLLSRSQVPQRSELQDLLECHGEPFNRGHEMLVLIPGSESEYFCNVFVILQLPDPDLQTI